MPECEQRRSLADFDDRQALAGKAIGLCLRQHRPQGGAQALAAGGAQGAAADRGWRAGTRADGVQRGFAAQQSGQVQADAAHRVDDLGGVRILAPQRVPDVCRAAFVAVRGG
ncbi:hypothetical protein G6F35_016490 [Rhizopus arrhizus]|nr:hypothetical protein G6F35_016490 [Rhizopus arrhizus]